MKSTAFNSTLMRTLILLCGIFTFTFAHAEIAIISTNSTTSGACNGEISTIVDGTAGPFEIHFYEVQDTQNVLIEQYEDYSGLLLNGELCVGTYLLIIENAYGCVTELSTTIQACEDHPILIEETIANTCTGTDGAIALNVTGGVNSEYTFHWDTQETTQNISNLAAGTYCVTITDATSCTTNACYDVEDISDPDFAIQLDEVNCICSGGFGGVKVTVNGNNGPYTYLWTSELGSYGATQEDISDVTEEGAYTINVFDANGCSLSLPIYIGECSFSEENINTTITNSCTAPNSGSITASVDPQGTSAPYVFIWTTSDGTTISEESSDSGYSSIDNLSAGEYCLTVLTANGCLANICGMIIQAFPPLIYDYAITPASTLGANDGTINLMLDPSTENPSFIWSNGVTSEDLINIGAGNYSVIISFEGGSCEEELELNVPVCAEVSGDFSLATTVTPLSGQGNDAAIDLTVVNGAGFNFDYRWVSQQTGQQFFTPNITHLAAGNYCVEVELDQCNVSLSTCVEVCNFGLSLTYDDLHFCGGTTVQARVDDEVHPFTYLWTNGSGGSSTNIAYDEEHCVTVTDQSGCMAVRCITIPGPSIELSFTTVDATLGNNNGAATVIPTGGISPYTYQWSNFGSFPTLSNLSADTYSVTVTDDCGNTAIGSVVVACEIGQDQVKAVIFPVSCGSGNGGTIDLEVLYDEPTPSNTYQWSNGATTEDISSLSVGAYCVTITNGATNCVYTNCYEVLPKGMGDFALSFTQNYPCLGDNNGSLTVSPTGGVSPYVYQWSSAWADPPVSANTATIVDISSGWYSVTVTDGLGCSVSSYTLLWPLPSFEVELNISDQTLCPEEQAYVSATPIGGTAPYSYEWQSCYPCEVIDNQSSLLLEGGLYFLKVLDAEGCQVEKGFYINESPKLNIREEITHLCDGNSAGVIDLSVSGGAPPYEYNWHTGATTNQINELSAGIYHVSIRDGNGCLEIRNYEVMESDAPMVSVMINEVLCEGGNNGSIMLTPSDNNTPYSYVWNNGSTTPSISELSADTYLVTLTNTYGCTAEQSYTITTSSTLSIIVDDVVGSQYHEGEEYPFGSIDISVAGGSAPYSYSWSGSNNYSSTMEDINQLYSGTYTLVVTDGQGCTTTQTIQMCNNPPVLVAQVRPFSTIPCVSGPGSISGLYVEGGSPPFTYEWSGPAAFTAHTATLEGLTSPGLYCVTVTDQCFQRTSTCQRLNCFCDISIGATGEHCSAGSDEGKIRIAVLDPYSYSYEVSVINTTTNVEVHNGVYYSVNFGNFLDESGEDIGEIVIDELIAGDYQIIATRADGCKGSIPFKISADNLCLVRLNQSDLTNTSYENLVAGYPYERYISHCKVTNACDDDIEVYELLEFEPFDASNPCYGGGRLVCSGCGDDFEIIVPADISAIQFSENNQCACLFSPGSMTDASFYEVSSWMQSEAWEYPVFATYDCNSSGVEPSDSLPGPSTFDYDCPCAGGCLYTNSSNCMVDVYCADNPEVPIDQVFAGQTLCYKEAHTSSGEYLGLNVYLECNVNPCDRFNVFACDNNIVPCTEQNMNDALAGYYDYFDCVEDNDCIADIYNLPECSYCATLDIAFTDPEDPNNRNFRTIEWLSSFDLLAEETESNPYFPTLAIDISPNPFSQELNLGIYLANPSVVNIMMVDLLGTRVWTNQYALDQGIHHRVIPPLNGLAPGIYQIFVQDGAGNTFVEKVVYQP